MAVAPLVPAETPWILTRRKNTTQSKNNCKNDGNSETPAPALMYPTENVVEMNSVIANHQKIMIYPKDNKVGCQ